MGGSFLDYYKRVFGTFGRELWATWRTEAWPTVLISLATYALTRHEDLNAWKTFLYTAEASGLYLGGWGIYHLIRAPWKLALKSPAVPNIGFKAEAIQLSEAISSFAYERSGGQPVSSASNRIGVSAEEMMAQISAYNDWAYRFKKYEEETLGIYGCTFARRVQYVVEKLEKIGLRDSEMDTVWTDPKQSANLKAIGVRLGLLADQLQDLEIDKL
jgi:hypothetical protein